MKLKRNIWKRAVRTAIQVVAGSGAAQAALDAFTSSGDVSYAVKTAALVAGIALASAVHGWLDNMLPNRRFADTED